MVPPDSPAARCPLCEAHTTTRLGRRSDFGDLAAYAPFVVDLDRFDREIVRCDRCGLGFSFPPYGRADVDSLYAGPGYVEFMRTLEHVKPTREHVAEWTAGFAAVGMEELADRVRAEGRTPTMIDVGCGIGNALRAFDRLGFAVTGIDPSTAEVEQVRRTTGFEVRCETLEEHRGSGRTYDVVVAMHVIEHVDDPVEFVRSLRSLVRPGGVVVLETPLTNDYGVAAQRYRDIYHTLFFDHFTLGLVARRGGLVPTKYRHLLFHAPSDHSWNCFMRVVLEPCSNDVDELVAARRGYEGLLNDADAWWRLDALRQEPLRGSLTAWFQATQEPRKRLAARYPRLRATYRSAKSLVRRLTRDSD